MKKTRCVIIIGMKYLIVSHRADLDGVASAVLMTQAVPEEHRMNAHVAFADYDDKLPLLSGVVDTFKPDVVWIGDLAFRINEFDDVYALLKDVGEVKFYDHHVSSSEFFDRVRESWPQACVSLDVSGDFCTADLVYNDNPDAMTSEWMEELRSATHSADLFLNINRNGTLLSMVITVLGANATFDMILADPSCICEEKFTGVMQACVEKCRRQDQKSFDLANWSEHSMLVTSLPGSPKIVLCFTAGNESVIGNGMAERHSPAWTIMLKPDINAVSMRTNQQTIDMTGISVADIAASFGGGGHPRAAGFDLPLPWLIKGMDFALVELADRIRSIHAEKQLTLAN